MGTDQYYSVIHLIYSLREHSIMTWLNQSAASTLSAFDIHDSYYGSCKTLKTHTHTYTQFLMHFFLILSTLLPPLHERLPELNLIW